MKNRHKIFVTALLVKLIMVTIVLSCRVRWRNRQVLEDLDAANDAYIISMWHNCSTIAGWAMRNGRASVIVSESRDGDYVSQLANLFGIKTIRGSSSRGALSAMRLAIDLLRNRSPLAITPDGPRGPRYKIQSGMLWLAATNNVPIVPLHIESSRQWVLNSWDRHRFPKPFSTLQISFGAPIYLDRRDLESDLQAVTTEVENQMMANLRAAQEFS